MTEEGRRVAVLGGCGFIGSHLCRALLSAGCSVNVFDKKGVSRDLVEDIEDDLRIVESDMSVTNDVISLISECQTVFHLIHTTVPGDSMRDPSFDVSSNVSATARWLVRLDETSVSKVVYISSGGTVYGEPLSRPISEDHPTNPCCSYGITKLAIEKYVQLFCERQNRKCVILRPSNVFGEGQRLLGNQGVLGIFIYRALSGLPLEIWGDGNSKRDYLYVGDFVGAAIRAASYEGKEKIFNVSSGRELSINDVVAAIRSRLGTEIATRYLEERGFDVSCNVLDSSRLESELRWRSEVSFEEGLDRLIGSLKTSGKRAQSSGTRFNGTRNE